MKMKSTYWNFVAISLAVAAFGTGCRTVDQKPVSLPFKVTQIRGVARCSEEGVADWRPLKRGQLLLPGALIQTAKDSKVTVVPGIKPYSQARNSVSQPHRIEICVMEDSVAVLKKSTEQPSAESGRVVTETEFDLQRGKLFVDTEKMTADSRLEVTIPGGRVQIREGLYLVDSYGNVGGWGKPLKLLMAGTNKVVEIPSGFLLSVGEDWLSKLPRPHRRPSPSPGALFPRADFSNPGVPRRFF